LYWSVVLAAVRGLPVDSGLATLLDVDSDARFAAALNAAGFRPISRALASTAGYLYLGTCKFYDDLRHQRLRLALAQDQLRLLGRSKHVTTLASTTHG
jgi:hypothetical protein